MQLPDSETIARQIYTLLASAPSGRWLWILRTTTYMVYAYLSEKPGHGSIVAIETFKDIQNPLKDKPQDFVVWCGDLDGNVGKVADLVSQSLPKMLSH